MPFCPVCNHCVDGVYRNYSDKEPWGSTFATRNYALLLCQECGEQLDGDECDDCTQKKHCEYQEDYEPE